MSQSGRLPHANLGRLGRSQHINLSVPALIEHAIARNEGLLSSNGTLLCKTGIFTGRSPKDRYIVRDKFTSEEIWWGDVNQGISPEKSQALFVKMQAFLADKELFVRDAYVGRDSKSRLRLRVYNTLAWHNLFCHHLFIGVPPADSASFEVSFTILCVPEFEANPQEDGTRSKHFIIVDITRQYVLIGGTSYAGEMKKSMFSVMNYLLPSRHDILPMHCAANVGKKAEDVSLFFGLSGTGKTTLSADASRRLIGDDEHGWDQEGVFNFEGGCYAKAIRLSQAQEPEIYSAMRFGSVLENACFYPNTRKINYDDGSITENTRAAYPLAHIKNVFSSPKANIPKYIFFLTADAFGVLPPISLLNYSQAKYYFLSGYTAKVAGTETGIKEPQAVFSACFGAPFFPLSPIRYTQMFGERIARHDTQVWLINTGWVGGGYGTGKRIQLSYTRAMIHAILEGLLENTSFHTHDIFHLRMPSSCEGVPEKFLHPKNLWENKNAYESAAKTLAAAFHDNFKTYSDISDEDTRQGAPA